MKDFSVLFYFFPAEKATATSSISPVLREGYDEEGGSDCEAVCPFPDDLSVINPQSRSD